MSARRPATRLLAALLCAGAAAGCAEFPVFEAPAAVNVAPKGPKPPPGAVNNAVTQSNVRRTICSNGWSATVRPSAAFLQDAKARLLREQGLANGEASRYELDFLIPIGLGGHPRKAENLWLQPREGAWSARTKDRLEAKLRRMVCGGEITLHEAREAMRGDWRLAARYYLSDRELLELE